MNYLKQLKNLKLNIHFAINVNIIYNKEAYRGSCLRQAKDHGKVIDPKDYGYYYSVDNLDSCTKGEKKNN